MRVFTVVLLAATVTCVATGPNALADDGRGSTRPFSVRVYGGYGLPSDRDPLYGDAWDGQLLLMFEDGVGAGYQLALEMGRTVRPNLSVMAGVRFFRAEKAAKSWEAIRSAVPDTVYLYTWEREIELDLVVPYIGLEYRIASEPAEIHLSAGIGLALGSAEVASAHSRGTGGYEGGYRFEGEGAEFHLGAGFDWPLAGPVGIGLDVQYYVNTIENLKDEGVRPAVLRPIDVPWTIEQDPDRLAIVGGIRVGI